MAEELGTVLYRPQGSQGPNHRRVGRILPTLYLPCTRERPQGGLNCAYPAPIHSDMSSGAPKTSSLPYTYPAPKSDRRVGRLWPTLYYPAPAPRRGPMQQSAQDIQPTLYLGLDSRVAECRVG